MNRFVKPTIKFVTEYILIMVVALSFASMIDKDEKLEVMLIVLGTLALCLIKVLEMNRDSEH